jgi:hypothetical protein
MGVVATAGTPAAGLLSAASRRRTRLLLLRILQLVRTVPAIVPFRLAAEQPVLEEVPDADSNRPWDAK